MKGAVFLKADYTQLKRIYALARELNISDGTRTDPLHELVVREVGKDSLSLLTHPEAERVARVLRGYLAAEYDRREKDGRSRYIWALMYELQKLDKAKNTAQLSARLAGIINRHLHLDVSENRPLYKLTGNHKAKIITILKGYIKSAGGGTNAD